MILQRDGLAGVVQQDREIEQLRLVQLAENSRVALVPFEFGLAQAVQIFNRLQRVFIHRETMRDIAHRQRVNPLQLRQEQRQQVQGVHGAQRVRRVRFRQNFFQKSPKVAAAGGWPASCGLACSIWCSAVGLSLKPRWAIRRNVRKKRSGSDKFSGFWKKIKPSTTEKSSSENPVRQVSSCL